MKGCTTAYLLTTDIARWHYAYPANIFSVDFAWNSVGTSRCFYIARGIIEPLIQKAFSNILLLSPVSSNGLWNFMTWKVPAYSFTWWESKICIPNCNIYLGGTLLMVSRSEIFPSPENGNICKTSLIRRFWYLNKQKSQVSLQINLCSSFQLHILFLIFLPYEWRSKSFAYDIYDFWYTQFQNFLGIHFTVQCSSPSSHQFVLASNS